MFLPVFILRRGCRVIKIRPNMEADREAILLALCTRAFTSKVIVFRYVCEHWLSICIYVSCSLGCFCEVLLEAFHLNDSI